MAWITTNFEDADWEGASWAYAALFNQDPPDIIVGDIPEGMNAGTSLTGNTIVVSEEAATGYTFEYLIRTILHELDHAGRTRAIDWPWRWVSWVEEIHRARPKSHNDAYNERARQMFEALRKCAGKWGGGEVTRH